MEIKELQPGQGNVNIELTVKSLEDTKVINKYGKDFRLSNAVVIDGEDEIKLTLWTDEGDTVKVGSLIKIENGYVNEFQGNLQLTTGKFGKLIVEDGENSEEAPTEEPKQEATENQESQENSSDDEVMDY